jgi:L-iditol 2-dehydrogenase
VPALNVGLDTFRLDDEISFEVATLIEPVACCLRALRRSNIQIGDSFLIIGSGATGIIHALLSKSFGASKVIVSDPIKFRLQAAETFGADVTVNPRQESVFEVTKAETDGRGADVVVVTAPNVQAYKTGLQACRRGGKLLIFAPTHPSDYMRTSLKELFFKEIQFIPSYSASHIETKIASKILRSKRSIVERLITHRFKLEDTAKAFDIALEGKRISLKILILNEEGGML